MCVVLCLCDITEVEETQFSELHHLIDPWDIYNYPVRICQLIDGCDHLPLSEQMKDIILFTIRMTHFHASVILIISHAFGDNWSKYEND